MLYLKNIFILYEFNVIVIEFFIKIENAYFGRRSVVRVYPHGGAVPFPLLRLPSHGAFFSATQVNPLHKK